MFMYFIITYLLHIDIKEESKTLIKRKYNYKDMVCTNKIYNNFREQIRHKKK